MSEKCIWTYNGMKYCYWCGREITEIVEEKSDVQKQNRMDGLDLESGLFSFILSRRRS